MESDEAAPMKALSWKSLGFFFAFFSCGAFAGPFCGTSQFQKHFWNTKNFGAAARSASVSSTTCDPEFYYDTSAIMERKTAHFRIYYVLEGPHRTSETWIDSLAGSLEAAWNFHTRKHGTKKPRGANPTWHFQKNGDGNLYPVEVLDISLVRDNAVLLGGFCTACMGLTFPPETSNPDETEIIIDNDFLYPDESNPTIEYISSSSCRYVQATLPVTNDLTGKNYSKDYGLALRTTAVHELYHAIQATYVDFLEYDSYWFEASATALEEIASPNANDYWIYLPAFFKSTGTAFDRIPSNYGLAVWGLYNLYAWNEDFDTRLWERFPTMPDSSFATVYAKELAARELDPDSAFADFAQRLFFAGDRSSLSDTSLRFTADFSDWPFSPHLKKPTVLPVTLEAPSIGYYRITQDTFPDLSQFVGKASVVLYGKNQKATFYSMDTVSWAWLSPLVAQSENAVLVLSRLQETSIGALQTDTLPIRSYPNPWRGETPLCFAGLPSTKRFLEIRTRAGKLVRRFSYTGTSFCIRNEEIRKLMAPGLYYFRAGAKNKAKPFLVVY